MNKSLGPCLRRDDEAVSFPRKRESSVAEAST
jgi:hypothetical protein